MPRNEDREPLLLLQLDPTPTPSSIRLDRLVDSHILEERVPVIQLDDRTKVLRLGKLNNDDGSDPVRLIDDIITLVKRFEVLLLNKDVMLPLRS